MTDFLSTLKNCIKNGKTIELKVLLADLKTCHPDEKNEICQILALASDKVALELLSYLTDAARADPQIQDRLLQLVMDRAHLNHKFALILFENADIKTLSHTTPLFKHILSNETNKATLSAILRGIGKTRLKNMEEDLAEFIFYDDQELKSDAIKALERIGTPQALAKLTQASKTEKCDQDILDAIQFLEHPPAGTPKQELQQETDLTSEIDTEELMKLSSPEFNERFEAMTALLQNESLDFHCALESKMAHKDHDIMVNLLRLVEMKIPGDAFGSLLDLLGQKKLEPTVKFWIYTALAAYPKLESAAVILKGLSENAGFVRMAAIKVLDKNPSDYVCAEIRTKIESGTKAGETLAHDILDAKARHLIEYLMVSDTFSYMASNYLSKNAPGTVLDTFISILEKRNLKSTAQKYRDMKGSRPAGNLPPLMVISANKVILNVYSKVIASCGWESLLFRRGQEAFEHLIAEKPSAIICDMFLKDMNGMDLCREIREIYPPGELPFIISCSQKSLDTEALQNKLNTSGITSMHTFPPKVSQIKSWVK